MTDGVGNQGPGLGQAENVAELNPSHFLIMIGY